MSCSRGIIDVGCDGRNRPDPLGGRLETTARRRGIGPPMAPKAGPAALLTVRSQNAEIRHIFADAGGRATVRSFIYAPS